MSTDGATMLGRFAVAADADEVAAFERAIGCAAHDGVLPPTFPMRWLAAPELRDAIETAAALGSDLVPFHESQTFDYDEPLVAGRAYTMSVALRRETAPDRLVVLADVLGDGERRLAAFETVLRLFSVGAAS